MSLVNLAHVCSHLQNASLARLGLTSIPYTKWHLSLALLLQKQGFLSQVKLGGPSPPASCFGQGPRDDHHVTNHPHGSAGRNRFSSEAALAKMVRQHWTPSQLQQYGFGQEAIEFAQEHGRRNLDQLNAQGWQQRTAQYLRDIRSQIESIAEEWDREYARRRELCEVVEQIQALDAELGATPEARFNRVQEDMLAQLQPEEAQTYTKYASVPVNDLKTVDFDEADISSIAGDKVFLTEREIRQNGITIDAMGLRIPNQQVTLPVEQYQDPDMLETEGVVTQANRASRRLWLGLKYYQSKPVLSTAKLISKPTKRIWLSSRDLAKVVRGRNAGEVKPLTQIGEIMAVSTDRGIMEARECVERKIGGQPLCRVW